MLEYNARVELDSRDFDETAVDVLMDLVADYDGTVARAVHGGRVELIFTVPAETIRQALITALSVVLATGHQVYAFEVLPAEEFHRRIGAVEVPPLLSVPQAAEALGVSRQRALQLVNAGQLDGVKVGDTWVIPAAAVASREEQTGLRWSGFVLPIGAHARAGWFVRDTFAITAPAQVPVFDEDGEVIGYSRTLEARPDGWAAEGVVRRLEPGEYAIEPRLHIEEQTALDDRGLSISRAMLEGLTVLRSVDAVRDASFPSTRITVTDTRAQIDLSHVERQAAEILTYR